jgi:hypothetical protein
MVDTPGIPAQRWSTDQKYVVISPGVESDDFKLDQPVTDQSAVNGLALSAAGRFVVKTLPSGSIGDVSGPASSTDNAVVRFDGTSGKTIQNSSVIISDTGTVTLPNTSGGVLFPPNGVPLSQMYTGGIPPGQVWSGPWTVNQLSGWDFDRFNSRAFVGLFGFLATNDGGNVHIASTIPLPPEGRPPVTRYGTLSVVNAGASAIGTWAVDPAGIITISSNASPISTFTGGGVLQAGFYTCQLEYFVG